MEIAILHDFPVFNNTGSHFRAIYLHKRKVSIPYVSIADYKTVQKRRYFAKPSGNFGERHASSTRPLGTV